MAEFMKIKELMQKVSTELNTKEKGLRTTLPQIRYIRGRGGRFEYVLIHYETMYDKEKGQWYYQKPKRISYVDPVDGSIIRTTILGLDTCEELDYMDDREHLLYDASLDMTKKENAEEIYNNTLQAMSLLEEITGNYLETGNVPVNDALKYFYVQLQGYSKAFSQMVLSFVRLTRETAPVINTSCINCLKKFSYSVAEKGLRSGRKYDEECPFCGHITQKNYEPKYPKINFKMEYNQYVTELEKKNKKENQEELPLPVEASAVPEQKLPEQRIPDLILPEPEKEVQEISEQVFVEQEISSLLAKAEQTMPKKEAEIPDKKSDSPTMEEELQIKPQKEIPKQAPVKAEPGGKSIQGLMGQRRCLEQIAEVLLREEKLPTPVFALFGGKGSGIDLSIREAFGISGDEIEHINMNYNPAEAVTESKKRYLCFWITTDKTAPYSLYGKLRNSRDKVIFLRGEKEILEAFFVKNPELKALVLSRIEYPPYNAGTLQKIFLAQLSDYGYQGEHLEDYMTSIMDEKTNAITMARAAERLIFQQMLKHPKEKRIRGEQLQ